jgi:hypothetical protein
MKKTVLIVHHDFVGFDLISLFCDRVVIMMVKRNYLVVLSPTIYIIIV